MYVAIVGLTMFILPLGSIVAPHMWFPAEPLVTLIGRWSVFWMVGVRLGLAGLRQIVQPSFTARSIFHLTSDDALPLVRELGVANAGTALVGLLSLAVPTFVLPGAISAGVFYTVAGLIHLGERGRSPNETVAMVSDLWAAVILLIVVVARVLGH